MEMRKWNMKIIQDQNKIRELIEREKISDYFDSIDLPFELHQYEKGEVLASPNRPLQSLLFLTDGTLQVYGILSDGGKLSIRLIEKPAILGDVEFCTDILSPLFTEAMTPVTCLALPIDICKETLDKDVKFLHVLLQSLVMELVSDSKSEVETPTLEDRLLFYFEKVFENHQLSGVEAATVQLRCSRRQLQRVLRKLCDEEKIVRVGKGKYRLNIRNRIN